MDIHPDEVRTTRWHLPARVPAISLWNPHAYSMMPTCRAGPLKFHETRGWVCPLKWVGGWFVIHAAKKTVARNLLMPEVRQLLDELRPRWESAPGGCALGIGILSQQHPTANLDMRTLLPSDRLLGDYRAGRFAWKFIGMQALRAPLPMRGRQGVFILTPTERASLLELLP